MSIKLGSILASFIKYFPHLVPSIILLDHLVLVKPCWLEQINDGVESGRDPVDKEQDKDTAKHVADGGSDIINAVLDAFLHYIVSYEMILN